MYIIIGGTGFFGTNLAVALAGRTRETLLVAARNPVEYCRTDMFGGVNRGS